ncbi:MAG TPA: iron-containing redox enzyme family protein [Candidatus Polarisedimenticolia bacterium]|nr:iron-containing redox enzyme family protein [Candidatus Polarisedimenticolia bacterium]
MKNTPLLEALLSVMDRKDHWAYPHFSEGRATRPQLLLHYQQEHAVYVRDFPILLSRVHARCPHAEVRQDLAENLYEEETGGLSKSKPHPELFLEMMQGLGFTGRQFERIDLVPEAAAYRAFVDQVTTRRPWIEGALVVTIFIEGSRADRREVTGNEAAHPADPEPGLKEHFLVRHYGVDPRWLDLKRAHHKVESGHRRMAWKMVLDHARGDGAGGRLTRLLEQTLALWLLYRDGVARASGIPFPFSSKSKLHKIK